MKKIDVYLLSVIRSFFKPTCILIITIVTSLSACREPKATEDKSNINIAEKADSIALIQSIEKRYPGIAIWDTLDYAYTLAYQEAIGKSPFILTEEYYVNDVYKMDSITYFRVQPVHPRQIFYEIDCSGALAEKAVSELVPYVGIHLNDAFKRPFRDLLVIRIRGFSPVRFSASADTDFGDEQLGEISISSAAPRCVRGELVEIIKGP